MGGIKPRFPPAMRSFIDMSSVQPGAENVMSERQRRVLSIVSDVSCAIRFHEQRRGREVRFAQPVEAISFAILGEDAVHIR